MVSRSNEVRIEVTGDAKDAEESLKSVQKNLRSLGDTARKVGIAMTALGGAAVFAGVNFVQAALEQERALATLGTFVERAGTSFASVREEILATTAALQRKTNFGDEVQIRSLQQMVALSGDYENSLKALPAVLDLATALNIDLNAAVNLVGRGLAGNTELFSRYGIEIAKGASATELITKLTAQFSGAAAANVDPLKQLSNAVGDLSEDIGKALLPVVLPLIEKLKDVTAAFSDFAKAHPQVIRFAAVAAAAVFGLGAALLAVGVALPIVTTGIHGLAVALTFLAAHPILIVGTAFAALVTLWVLGSDKMREKIEEVTEATLRLTPGVGRLILEIGKLVDKFTPAREVITEYADEVRDLVTGPLKDLEAASEEAKEVMANVTSAIEDMASGISGAADEIQEAASRIEGLARSMDRVALPTIAASSTLHDMSTESGLVTAAIAKFGDQLGPTGTKVAGFAKVVKEAVVEFDRMGIPLVQTRLDLIDLNTPLGRADAALRKFTDGIPETAKSLEELTRETGLFGALMEIAPRWAELFATGLIDAGQAAAVYRLEIDKLNGVLSKSEQQALDAAEAFERLSHIVEFSSAAFLTIPSVPQNLLPPGVAPPGQPGIQGTRIGPGGQQQILVPGFGWVTPVRVNNGQTSAQQAADEGTTLTVNTTLNLDGKVIAEDLGRQIQSQ